MFLVRGGDVEAKTRPHLLVDHAIATGHLTPEQAKDFPHKHVICRALGGEPANDSAPETIGPWPLLDGDRIVVCYRRVADSVPIDSFPVLLAGSSAEAAATTVLDLAARVERSAEAAVIVITVKSG